MTDALETHGVYCPYWGEPLELLVDPSAGEQAYVEDCAVCCRPIECRVYAAGDGWQLAVSREDD